MRHPIRCALAALVLIAGLPSGPLAAQSTLSASVAGTVTDAMGGTLPRVLVSLNPVGAGTYREMTTDNQGAFVFRLVVPGTYEVRAEAIGYRPLVARTLEVSGGDALRVPLELTMATPPVVEVDTVALASAATNRVRPGGVRLGSSDLEELPHRFDDLASVVGLSTQFGPELGSQGLPGSMSLVVADGMPVYRAPHPFLRREHLPDAFFPRAFLSSVTALHDAPDVEWSGAAGGYASVSTLSGIGASGVEIDGSWSGSPLWSSSELDLGDVPGLTSYRASGGASVDIRPDTTQLLVASEVLQHEAPVAARIGPGLVDALEGLDRGLLTELAAPSVERVSRYSGLGRFYTQPNETSRLFFRGALSRSERSFDGPGPLAVGGGGGLAETSTEYSLASSFVSAFRPGLTLEFRAGVSGSDRTFESAMEGLPSAYLVEAGLPLGAVPAAPAESSRLDAILLPMARFEVEEAGAFRFGFSVRVSRFTMASAPWGAGDFLFTDAAALLGRRGYARIAEREEESFSTREFGVFAQWDGTPTPGLELSVGGRFDWETIPSAEPRLSQDWLDVSGLRNDAYPSSFPQGGARASIAWDPFVDGRTRIFAAGSIHSGDVDPARLFEVFALDGSVQQTVHAGFGTSWPDAALPSSAPSLPTLALFGPDLRPPRSWRATAGAVRSVAGGLSLHVSGDVRRTDFLLRRRDLNRPEVPIGQSLGRDVYGALAKDGALVTATGADARRFAGFGPVWALDPDGWSEYRAVTAGFELRTELVDLHGAYTRSETTDNWIGAAAGSPEAELPRLMPEHLGTWDEGTSDFDVPDRATLSAVLRVPSLPGSSIGASYRYASGRPFTPGYRRGVDANGDGSFANDVPFVPQPDELGALLEDHDCLRNQAGDYAVRNSCRGPARHALDARVRVGLGRLAGQPVSVYVEGLDLLETEDGLIDEALLLVDPDQPLGGGVRLPTTVNPRFGAVIVPGSRGRMLRIGMRIGR